MFNYSGRKSIPNEAMGLRLAKITKKDELVLCEDFMFYNSGLLGIDLVLRRAAISGKVEVNGKIENYFADILDDEGSMIGNISLDKESYGALKNKWMPCKIDKSYYQIAKEILCKQS